jgi:hypothetical protein
MNFKSTGFDLESLDSATLGAISKDLESIDLSNGYSRADLESIESKLIGAFTDIEDFDFREIPTGISRVNINIVERRLHELRLVIGQGISNRYHVYANVYGSLIHELNNILRVVSKFEKSTPSPLLDNLDTVYLYDTEFDSIKLTDAVFSKYNMLYTKVKLLRDVSKNDKINSFNYLIETMIKTDDVKETKKEYSYSILKKVLEVSDVTYENTITLFSNSNKLKEFINNTTDELLTTLSEVKDIISWDYCNDELHSRWASSSARLDKYTALANDRDSFKLLTLLSVFRYFDHYKK